MALLASGVNFSTTCAEVSLVLAYSAATVEQFSANTSSFADDAAA